MRRRIVIIGGGASGLVAAIGAAGTGADVTIVEHMDRVGKKILSTGNGRCNLTNLRMVAACYRCGQEGVPMEVIRGFGVDKTLAFFKGLGIEPKDRNGYIYPNSDQASAVLDVLRCEVERLGVVVLLSCNVEKIVPVDGNKDGKVGGEFKNKAKKSVKVEEDSNQPAGGRVRYKVYTDQGVLDADAVILAAGSKAAPSTGSDGSGYELAKMLGHRVIKPLPALVQLRCQGNMYRQMAGIRTDARVKLMAANELLAQDRGELQLTDYGLSGIPVFQVSRFAARALDQGKKVTALVDFMPSWDDGEAFGLLKKRAALLGHKTAEELFTGLLNKKLALVLIKLAGIQSSRKAGELSSRQLKLLLEQIKTYEAIVMSVNPFANAQVCCGGVDTREVDASTMESRLHDNLYLAGELLDVDGICGGYNLQFAWSSGMTAGIHAANGKRNRK